MINKHRLRTLGLPMVTTVGLLALGSSSASAENLTVETQKHGKILVLASEHLLASFAGISALGQLLVPLFGIEIHCTQGEILEGKIVSGLSGEALLDILFKECKVYEYYENEEGEEGEFILGEKLPCDIINGGTNDHIRAKALLVITHKSVELDVEKKEIEKDVLYVVAEPDPPNTLFTEIKFKSGEGCPIPLTSKIGGTYAMEVTQTHSTKLTVTGGDPSLQTLLGTKMKYGVVPTATINGTGSVELAWAHLGCSWGVV